MAKRSLLLVVSGTLAAFVIIVSSYFYYSSNDRSSVPNIDNQHANKTEHQIPLTNSVNQPVEAHDLTDWTNLKPAYQTYKIEINSDSSLQTDKQAIELYGIKILVRNQICKYRNGEKWACGQRAYIALINVLGSKFADCRPHDINRPAVVVCQLAGVDIGEMMLREGWANLVSGVTDKNYIDAAAEAIKYKKGMWREQPKRTAAN
jgi:endonuclease YncB( thermonuclease family)